MHALSGRITLQPPRLYAAQFYYFLPCVFLTNREMGPSAFAIGKTTASHMRPTGMHMFGENPSEVSR